jgi:hypothetical protein
MYIYTAFEFLYLIEYYTWIGNIYYKKNYPSNIAKKNSIQTFGMFFILSKRKKEEKKVKVIFLYYLYISICFIFTFYVRR